MAGLLWLRVALLCVAPVATLLLRANGVVVAVVCGSSLVAAGVDVVRQRRPCLPFPIYLLIIYGLQFYSLLALPKEVGAVDALEMQGLGQESLPSVFGSFTSQTAMPGPRIETMSVVIAAHNEHKYMNRTLASIYSSTPASVLKEIIVVDDASDPPLASSLQDYHGVRLLRHEKRTGLIKSKTDGGNIATSDMIMFLDGHVKPEPDWWRPILKHMNTNYKRVVVPVIPILDGDTWMPNLNAYGIKMMFDWTLFFQWFEDNNDLVPCMSGGLFGITRRWWHESGEYDYGMSMWGAENIEQSIRVWLCGGEIYVARNSLVSHVFRTTFPYSVNNTEIYINKVRTVETWFDEYKENFYKADPGARQFAKFRGDISERLALRERLKCKPFKWYVEKFKSVFAEKHMLPEEVFLFRDTLTGHCLEITADRIGVHEAACDAQSQQQQWAKTPDGFRNVAAQKCFDANAGVLQKEGSPVFLYRCFPQNAQQMWKLQNGRITWQGFCIKGRARGKLTLESCAAFLQASGNFEMHANHMSVGPGVL